MSANLPKVTVVTPVYNGEKYLDECIQSVISQSYTNYEYHIVNNCSTDKSLEIALKYASNDERIKIINNTNFVGVIENHNIAFRSISPESQYCKVVSADDWIYPQCIELMVAVAEANPSVGIVGAYQISGGGEKWEVKWDGLPCSKNVFVGHELCRSTLLGGKYVFGCPTSVLYRSSLIKGVTEFYPNTTPYADTSAFYEYLRRTDFGFVHQVLSHERLHSESICATERKNNFIEARFVRDFIEYGPIYLTEPEYKQRLEVVLDNYYSFLAYSAFHTRNKEFWNYHTNNLSEIGHNLLSKRLVTRIINNILDIIFNPKQTLEKILRRIT